VDEHLTQCFGRDWLKLAAGGGEDFELLVAVAEPEVAHLRAEWPDTLAPLSEVGRLREGSGVRLLDKRGGAELPLPPSASEHFA
jgi:thiamine monophosphate kinase